MAVGCSGQPQLNSGPQAAHGALAAAAVSLSATVENIGAESNNMIVRVSSSH